MTMEPTIRAIKQHIDSRKHFPAKDYDALVDRFETLKAERDNALKVLDNLNRDRQGMKAERDKWKKVAEEKYGVHAADAFMERNEANLENERLKKALDCGVVLAKEARSRVICGCAIPCDRKGCGCFACHLDEFVQECGDQ